MAKKQCVVIINQVDSLYASKADVAEIEMI